MMEKIIESNKEQDTYDLGYELGQHAKPGQVFTLVGDLGLNLARRNAENTEIRNAV